MRKKYFTKKKIKAIIYVVIVVAIVAVLSLFVFYFSQQTKLQEENTELNSLGMQEKEQMDTTRSTLEQLLAEKNGWDVEKFDIVLVYGDNRYIMANIIPSDTTVPEGSMLATIEGDTYYILFDSTDATPCSTLNDTADYPLPVLEMCSNVKQPDTTDVPSN